MVECKSNLKEVVVDQNAKPLVTKRNKRRRSGSYGWKLSMTKAVSLFLALLLQPPHSPLAGCASLIAHGNMSTMRGLVKAHSSLFAQSRCRIAGSSAQSLRMHNAARSMSNDAQHRLLSNDLAEGDPEVFEIIQRVSHIYVSHWP